MKTATKNRRFLKDGLKSFNPDDRDEVGLWNTGVYESPDGTVTQKKIEWKFNTLKTTTNLNHI
jgi:hypothetical protein